GQLAMRIGADEEVDVRRTLAVATEREQQLLGGAARRHAVAIGHDAAEAVATQLVGDDGAAHVERRLRAGRVEVRVEAAGIAMPDFDAGAWHRLAIGAIYRAMHDQQLAIGVATVIEARRT